MYALFLLVVPHECIWFWDAVESGMQDAYDLATAPAQMGIDAAQAALDTSKEVSNCKFKFYSTLFDPNKNTK